MFLPFWDPTLILLIPGILLALWAQMKVKSTFKKWSKVMTSNKITGVEIARNILDNNGLNKIPINETKGHLTDNYNPIKKTLNLSQPVYSSSSVAAVGIAAHEAGHAIQHKNSYFPLSFRNGIYPIANFSSWLSYPLVIMGIIMSTPVLIKIGILLFSAFVVFTVITLPVEYNASRRAVRILTRSGTLNRSELAGVKKVLNAAALTYVASALTSLLNLLRLLILSGDRD